MAGPSWPLCWLRVVCVLYLLAPVIEVQAFSWSSGRSEREATAREPRFGHHDHLQPLRLNGRPSSVYAVALSELQELESEPLCHRIAARLLVNNCQLLDGQDEATVLADSGRATRDFVDFFAASLAICDLERGSFVIPSPCSKFREPVLAVMPVPSKPHLHVSSLEIDNCLEGLARSDSAWNTWVSYRHKALRFCEAARADNEKDNDIYLYRRLTKILAKLTDQVEVELETRFEVLNKMFRDTTADMEGIAPQVGDLKAGLLQVEQILSGVVSQRTQETAATVRDGLEDAKNLQQLVARLIATVLENDKDLARSHESALQVVTNRVDHDVETVVTTLGSVIVASNSLQRELAESQSRAAEIARRQDRIEAGMERLAVLAGALTLKQRGHQERLEQAQQTATQVLNTLESVSTSAGTFRNYMSGSLGFTKWWPYIFCPATSLIIGSYGLPPSAMRNILLLGLGEGAGLLVSLVHRYIGDFENAASFANDTLPIHEATHLDESFYMGERFYEQQYSGPMRI